MSKDVITKVKVVATLRTFCVGGFKDSKKGGALRLTDAATLLKSGKYRVVQTWRKGNWNGDYYPTK